MQPAAQLLITLTADGQIQVAGPLENRVLCYGLLESARDAVREYVPPTIQTPAADVAKRLLAG